MTKYLILAYTDAPDPLRENEYNEWYDNIHLPDVLETPGVINGTRYVCTTPNTGPGKFLALYDVESDNINGVMEEMRVIMDRKRKEGRLREGVDLVTILVATYKRISSLQTKVGDNP
ncbi:MAG: hypothetical protein PHI12_06055 [Dehalococcoidales bacterium]|nr:hypothetical protein [Dehalococcoidales bacterium]